MNNNGTKTVLVLGMHRSGTSVMTAALQKVFDVKLYESKSSLVEDNPKGYFEDFEVVDLNDRLLEYFNTSWDNYGIGKDEDLRESPFYEEAQKILKKNYEHDAIWGLKDPRVSVLLPFWEDILQEYGTKIYRIVALRHPLEVALSQKARHSNQSVDPRHLRCGLDIGYMLNLWFWYNLKILNDIPDDNNIIISFNNIIENSANEVKRIGQFLGMSPNPTKLEEYTESFLERQLKHHNITETDISQYRCDYSHVFDLYDHMKEYATKNSFSKDNAVSILGMMPDVKFLSSWSSPIYNHFNLFRDRLDRLEKAQNYANKAVQENNHLRDELYQVYRSGSWRITAPLRKITALLRKLRS